MRQTSVRLAAIGLLLATLAVLVDPATSFAQDDGCDGFQITIVATGGTTYGTRGDDVIQGSAGDDTIDGRGGNDIICDLRGTNLLIGGVGDDYIIGTGTLQGGSGNDSFDALDLGTIAQGGSGNDEIRVYNRADALGGAGDDSITLYGNHGGTVNGGSGNDYILAYVAASIYGGSGKDTIEVRHDVLFVDCGSGFDTYYASNGSNPTPTACERVISLG